MDLTRTFPKALKEGTRQVPRRLPIAFGQLHGSKVPSQREGQSWWIPRELGLVSEASGLDRISAALLGTSRVGTGPGSDCGTAYGLS